MDNPISSAWAWEGGVVHGGSGVLTAVGVLVAGLAGAVVGAGIRVLLGHLRRGVVLRVGVAEVATAIVTAAGTGLAWGEPAIGLVLLAGVLMVALSSVDIVHHRLPDAITLPALPVTGFVVLLHLSAGAGIGLTGPRGFRLRNPVVGGLRRPGPDIVVVDGPGRREADSHLGFDDGIRVDRRGGDRARSGVFVPGLCGRRDRNSRCGGCG